MIKEILSELKEHAPFTLFGTLTGVVVLLIFQNIPSNISYNTFYVLHPMHVVLSALVTTSMFKLHSQSKTNIFKIVIIGYVGSVGITTLSDSVIPYVSEIFLKMPSREAHLGFIEEWWLVNPLAFLGIAIAYFWPTTKFPHSGHVLLSTWASLFHVIMARCAPLDWISYSIIFLFLFLAVWIPCCLSDIIFPLLFVKPNHKYPHY